MMEQQQKNIIDAQRTSIKSLLIQKFTIDYFQREYMWQETHFKLLVEDLTSTFLKSYNESDECKKVLDYQSYYLGAVVFNVNNESQKSVIDGQQRITSIILLLMYLNLLQVKNKQVIVVIDQYMYSESGGQKSFNMADEARNKCLQSLLAFGQYKVKEDDDQTIKNIVNCYDGIKKYFPDELKQNALPLFISWFIEKVVIVEITAYSEENAYAIFETMNDRGLNLTPTEMLKSYILSKITNKEQRSEINVIWKNNIKLLHAHNDSADLNFFQAWFRAKYADPIRPDKVSSENKDFELIGTRFHAWFKENHKGLFQLNKSEDFYEFFKLQFPFFVERYLDIYKAQGEFDKNLPHVYYINTWGIAESLQEPFLLASISFGDSPAIIKKKLDFVSRYIETFTVLRSVNNKKFGQASIKYTMFAIIKSIRDKDLTELGNILTNEIKKLHESKNKNTNEKESWNGITNLRLHHGQNKKFIKHLLSRISSYVDNLIGKVDNTYVTYYTPTGKLFEIEHLWADKFEEHRDEFEQKTEFDNLRNYIGALVLLPQGTNQSYNSDPYEDKLEHYLKENTYAQTLNNKFYDRNPNFLNNKIIKDIHFTAHPHFKKNDLFERQKLVQRICENLWSTEYFKTS